MVDTSIKVLKMLLGDNFTYKKFNCPTFGSSQRSPESYTRQLVIGDRGVNVQDGTLDDNPWTTRDKLTQQKSYNEYLAKLESQRSLGDCLGVGNI